MTTNCEKRANDMRELENSLFSLENKICDVIYRANSLIKDDTKNLSLLIKLVTYIEIAGISCSRAIELAVNSLMEETD